MVDVFRRCKINTVCVQAATWSGNSTRELGDGYKIFYSGEINTRSGVGVILDEKLKQQIFEVQRQSDKLIRAEIGDRSPGV